MAARRMRLMLGLAFVSSVILAPASSTVAGPASQGIPFADSSFQRVWTRTDAPVENGKVARSFYWGPQPNSGPLMEDFAEGPNGKHLVQYFDKGRMEINNPAGDKSDPFYVTTGLLTLELISGYIQTGMYTKQDYYRAEIPVAGDMDDVSAPTYASFRNLLSASNSRPVGEAVITTIDRAGTEGADPRYSKYNVKIAQPDNSADIHLIHNIPDIFWNFLNVSGPVSMNGAQLDARLSDPWFYITGYPITEAYWVNVKIGGKPTDVLLQAYERRVLTYVPSLPSGWQVQMGNIGQHYFDWRYNNAGRPTKAYCAAPPAGKMGLLWSGNTTLQLELGCPAGADSPGTHFPTTFAIQHFEHGHMIDSISEVPASGGITTLEKQIYVLYEDGTSAQYADIYNPADPQPTPPVPPPGLYTPTSGFGQVWIGQTGVRERLGWAIAPETTLSGAAFQYFEHGLVIDGGAAERKFYVLYDNSGLINSIDHWAVYDDTF